MKHHLKHINKHDIAKVLVGFSASEIISHLVLGVSGFFAKLQALGLPVSPSLNIVMLVIWAVVGVGSAHYAWFKKK